MGRTYVRGMQAGTAEQVNNIPEVSIGKGNACLPQLASQPFDITKKNGAHTKLARAFEIYFAVVYEKTVSRRPLTHLQSEPIDCLVRFPQTQKTRTEEHRKVTAQTELFQAIDIQIQAFVVDN